MLCILSSCRLIIVYLFIARFLLSYVAMLFFRVVALRISAKLRLAYLKVWNPSLHLIQLPNLDNANVPSGLISALDLHA